MKILKTTLRVRDKARVMTVELQPGEDLVAIRRDGHYQLGYPLDDVVASHILADAAPVTWCPLEQKWVK